MKVCNDSLHILYRSMVHAGYLISQYGVLLAQWNTKWPTLEDLLLHYGVTWFGPSIEILYDWSIIGFDCGAVGMQLMSQFDTEWKFLSKTLGLRLYNPLADADLPCEWETGNSHDPKAVSIKKVMDGMVGTLQVVGHVATKENIFNLFDISAYAIVW